MVIFADIEWDTGLTLTVILAPLCLFFFSAWFLQFGRIKELKHDAEAAIAKATELERRLTDVSAHKDADIQRQQDEIVKLQKDLEVLSGLKASLKDQTQLQNRIRQLENMNQNLEAQLRAKILGW